MKCMKKLLTFYIIEKVTFENGVRREKDDL